MLFYVEVGIRKRNFKSVAGCFDYRFHSIFIVTFIDFKNSGAVCFDESQVIEDIC